MAQTLYAVVALGAISLLTYNAVRDDASDKTGRVERVLAAESRGVLREMLEDGENRPFDENPIAAIYTDASGFGPRSTAPTGAALDSLALAGAVTDLDDVHGLSHVKVYRWMEEPVAGIEQPIVFDASFHVEYVAPGTSGNWEPSLVPTPHKRVTAQVEHRLSPAPYSLTRIYADFR